MTKNAFITGGNSGIGKEMARALAAQGFRVIIASRDQTKSQAAVDEILAEQGDAPRRPALPRHALGRVRAAHRSRLHLEGGVEVDGGGYLASLVSELPLAGEATDDYFFTAVHGSDAQITARSISTYDFDRYVKLSVAGATMLGFILLSLVRRKVRNRGNRNQT